MRETMDLENGAGVVKTSNSAPTTYTSTQTDTYRRWTSWLIPLFLVANIAMFVVVMFVNNCPKNIHHNSQIVGDKCVAMVSWQVFFPTLEGKSSLWSRFQGLGALEWSRVVHKQGWRLFSSIWLHAGLIHLVVNMLSLALIGIRLEQECGFVRVGIIYLLSGIGGGILSSLFIQRSISVGASGALFGLLGAMLSELITNWSIYTDKVASLFSLLVIIVLNLAVGILPHVDNYAHIGGFITGFLLGFVLLPRPQYGWLERHNLPADVHVKSKYKTYQIVLLVLSFILLIAGFTVGLVLLFKRVNGYDHCHWCRYLSCVPTSKWKCDGV